MPSSVERRKVALIPPCEECRPVWLPIPDRERWQAHWIDDGPEEKLVFYCPECAEREFGDVGASVTRVPSADRRLVLAVPSDTGTPHSSMHRNQLGFDA